MRNGLVAAAAAIVLLANAWVVVSARRNQAADPGGTVELTERELRLPPVVGDSTAIGLELAWRPRWSDIETNGPPAWLTVAKLEELGFDCGHPASSPHAGRHYGAITPRLVLVVLEFEGEAWQRAPGAEKHGSRLFAVDAGRDARRLREKYPDKQRWILARGLIKPCLFRPQGSGITLAPPPRVAGILQAILPDQIFVPKPHNLALQPLRRKGEEGQDDRHESPPRYAVTVSWGADHLPWVRSVRLLPLQK